MIITLYSRFQMDYGIGIRIILPKEKPFKTIGRPIVPFRKVLLMMVFYTFSNNEMSMTEDAIFWIGIWFNMS
jgi:hypothetical protein